MIRDWRWGCIKNEGFESMIVESEQDLRTIDTPLLHLRLTENDNSIEVGSSFFSMFVPWMNNSKSPVILPNNKNKP